MIPPREPRKYLHLLPHVGMSAEHLLADHGFDWPAIDALVPIPVTELARLIDVIATNTPREFSLFCGSSLPFSRLGVFGYAMMNCPTLRTMFELWDRCSLVAGHPLAGSLTVRNNTWSCEMRSRLPLTAQGLRFVAEATAVGFLKLCREYLAKEHPLTAVEFPFAAPRDDDLHIYAGHAFGTVGFGTMHLRMTGLLEDLDQPVSEAEDEIREMCERRCYEQLAAMRVSLPAHTRLEMLALASDRIPTAGEAARRLGISKRTLFRQICAEGSSFQRVIDDVRQQLAFRMLDNRHFSSKEIGWRLGFSDSRSFRRKFAEWTGMPVAAWRDAQAVS